MKNFLIAFAIVFAYKLISNVFRCLLADSYISKHAQYITSAAVNITMFQHEIRKLAKMAGMADKSIPHMQDVGGGQAAIYKVNIFDCLTSRDADEAITVGRTLIAMKGVFASRIKECFSPLYWIELVIYLPKNLIEYIGFSGDAAFSKVLQLLWWVSAPAAIFFRDQLYVWISQIFQNLQ